MTKRTKKSTDRTVRRPAPDRPLTARAVAELCGVELKTVHNWALEGRLAHFRTPGRHLRFQPEVVEAFLSECGYTTATSIGTRVICVARRPSARLRQVLSSADCTWLPDVWNALLEIGRAAPDVWIVDAKLLPAGGFDAAALAVRAKFPDVKIAVLSERSSRTPRSASDRLCYVDLEALAALLSQQVD